MRDLFISEWHRFRRPALGVAIAHLIALGLMSRAIDLMALGYQDQFALLIVYMLLALTLAVLQVGSYRQPGRWLWLVHRPLPTQRIFGALALAATSVVGVAILLPLLIFVVATEVLTTQVVDVRHYITAIHAAAFAMMAWLAGAHACTSQHKAAVAILLAPMLLALHPASVWALLPGVVVSLAWLALVAGQGFRADRGAPIRRHSMLLLTALPLQLAFFVLIFHFTKGGIALADLVARGNTGRSVTTADVDIDIEAHLRAIGVAFWTRSLESSTDARAASWRAQLGGARLAGLTPDIERFPLRHQLGNVERPWWDGRRGIKWTFSHDRMMYHGRDQGTGASRGWWGEGGRSSTAAFADVPTPALSRSTLYTIDRDTTRQAVLLRLPEGEWFTSRPVRALDRTFILTSDRLLALARPADTLAPVKHATIDWSLPIEDAGLRPISVDVAEVADGWLVSLFYFDDWEFDGFEFLLRPWQQIVHVDANGRATHAGGRRDIRDHRVSIGVASAVPVASWWVSPPLYALAHVPDLIDTGLTQPPRFELLPSGPAMRAVALALMLASTFAAWLWLRRVRATPARRRLWLASCFVLGLPAFLSLLCLEPRLAECT